MRIRNLPKFDLSSLFAKSDHIIGEARVGNANKYQFATHVCSSGSSSAPEMMTESMTEMVEGEYLDFVTDHEDGMRAKLHSWCDCDAEHITSRYNIYTSALI